MKRDTKPFCRPAMIPADRFREWMTTAELSRIFSVGDVRPTSFINRCEKDGNPVRSMIGADGTKRFRPIDVCAKAHAYFYEIAFPEETRAKTTLADLHLQIDEARNTLLALKNQHMERAHEATFFDLFATLTRGEAAQHDFIVEAAMPYQKMCGIYFLVQGRSVVYVGQSIDVAARVASHTKSKSFEKVCYIPCQSDELDVMESLYIHFLRPQLNHSASRQIVAPMSFEQLVAFARESHNRFRRAV